MNDPWNWTLDDLRNLIASQVPESATLEYKAAAALQRDDNRKTSELTKDVSAFANSGGGTLVYGIAEDKDQHIPLSLDGGCDPKSITKEWLEQIINSQIQRRIDGVRINPVPLDAQPGSRVAYVIYVPQSLRAPHQAADKKFYKRFNFQSVPMEEYEIRDVARRQETPDLRVVYTHVEPGVGAYDPFKPGSRSYPFNIAIANDSDTPAEHAFVQLWVEERLRVVSSGNLRDISTIQITRRGIQMRVYQTTYSASDGMPIFKGLNMVVTSSPFVIALPDDDAVYLLRWKILAPRMSARESFSYLELGKQGTSIGLDDRLVNDADVYADSRIPWPWPSKTP